MRLGQLVTVIMVGAILQKNSHSVVSDEVYIPTKFLPIGKSSVGILGVCHHDHHHDHGREKH